VTQLVDDGNPYLRTAEIAERAEVSVRSIFHHLPDLEALYLSVVDAQLRGILTDLQPVRTEGNLDERVSALVSERAKLSERALPMRKLAARFEALSDASRRGPGSAATSSGGALLTTPIGLPLGAPKKALICRSRRE
jgi:AcrR family transcriptional regulator